MTFTKSAVPERSTASGVVPNYKTPEFRASTVAQPSVAITTTRPGSPRTPQLSADRFLVSSWCILTG